MEFGVQGDSEGWYCGDMAMYTCYHPFTISMRSKMRKDEGAKYPSKYAGVKYALPPPFHPMLLLCERHGVQAVVTIHSVFRWVHK